MGSVPVARASANSLEVTEERFQIRGKLRNGMSTRSYRCTPGASLHPGTTLGTLSLSPITVHPRTRPALQSLLCSAPTEVTARGGQHPPTQPRLWSALGALPPVLELFANGLATRGTCWPQLPALIPNLYSFCPRTCLGQSRLH